MTTASPDCSSLLLLEALCLCDKLKEARNSQMAMTKTRIASRTILMAAAAVSNSLQMFCLMQFEKNQFSLSSGRSDVHKVALIHYCPPFTLQRSLRSVPQCVV